MNLDARRFCVAMADQWRYRIVDLLCHGEGYSAKDVATLLCAPRPSVSYHLVSLERDGLIVRRRDRRAWRYFIDSARLAQMKVSLDREVLRLLDNVAQSKEGAS